MLLALLLLLPRLSTTVKLGLTDVPEPMRYSRVPLLERNWVVVVDQGLTAQKKTNPFNGFSGTTRVSQYQKGKANLDFTEKGAITCQHID